MLALDIAYTIYIKFDDLASALRIALHLDNSQVFLILHPCTLIRILYCKQVAYIAFCVLLQYVKQVFASTDDILLKKQFSYIIGRHVSRFYPSLSNLYLTTTINTSFVIW